MTEDSSKIESALAAVADGSLPSAGREQLLAKVAEQPQLAEALATQQRAVELIGSVSAQVSAPASLHRQVNMLVSSPSRARPLRARVATLGALGAAAVAAIVLALSSLGGSAAPTFKQIRALTLSRPTTSGVLESTAHHNELNVSVQGLAFPYWGERLGWQAAGARTDHIAGRSLTTVFYVGSDDRRIGYAILAGSAPHIDGGSVVWRGGVPYRLMVNGATASVSWQRSGHLCVVSGDGVSVATLLRLASWGDTPA